MNGQKPSVRDLRHPAAINYGHFTSMQVRSGKVRGLQLHIERIERSHVELFGTPLDIEMVLDCMRLAVSEMADCYLRTVLYESERGTTAVMTVQRPAVRPSDTPISLLPVEYQRSIAHVKHVGTFSKIYQAVVAERAGFDDAVHTTTDGLISETTGANIGFWDDAGRVVWPTQPSLPGITWHLLEPALAQRGVESVREPVSVSDVAGMREAFLTNSIGIAPVGRIGDHEMGDPSVIVDLLRLTYDEIPWDAM